MLVSFLKSCSFCVNGKFSVFEMAFRGRGFLQLEQWEILQGDFLWPFEFFSKLKTTFCKYWTYIKIKVSMTCMYQVYWTKIEMVQQVWQLKTKFFFSYNNEIVIQWEGIKFFVGRESLLVLNFSWWWGELANFWLVVGGSLSSC